jgi:hypothetical protein
MKSADRDLMAVSYAPVAVVRRTTIEPPESTLTGHSLASFDNLVGAGEDRWRHGEAERLRGLEIEDQLECGRLLDR